MACSLTLAVALALTQASPYELPIGRPGTWLVQPGRLTDLHTYRSANADDVARASRGRRFVFLGEQHATASHQQFQADVIEALARDGRSVVVGLEMYQRSKQPVLDKWSAGSIQEADFLSKSDWKGQWGFDYAYYRPVFDSARRHRFPVLGLNVPRDWVRTVGRGGVAALSADQRAQIGPNFDLQNKHHRSTFEALMGGHPGMTAAALDNMYAAQVLWDEAMADTIVRHLEASKPSAKTVYVVIAGAGHLMYGQGINYRLQQRRAGTGPLVVMLESSEPVRVSNGLADYVYVSPAPRK